jgi:hypothetical protein
MSRGFLASTGLALFAMSGCKGHVFTADSPAEMRVVYVDDQPDHCIVVDRTGATPASSSPRARACRSRRSLKPSFGGRPCQIIA